jgi:membrane protein
VSSRLTAIGDRLPPPVARVGLLPVRTAQASVDHRIHGLAAEAAFYALLSIPPLMLAIVGSIGYIAGLLGTEARERIEIVVLDLPGAVLTPAAAGFVQPMLEQILAEGRFEIVSLGFLIALWGGSRSVNVFLVALPIAYGIDDPRPVWQRRVLAYALTLGGALVLAVLIPALILGPALIVGFLPGGDDGGGMIELAFWPILGLVTLLLIAVLYDIGVPWHTPFRRDLPGALLAMALWLLGAAALRSYVEAALRTDDIYGPLATPLVVLLWLYLTAFAVLLGAELNAEIERTWPHKPRDDEDRDESDYEPEAALPSA